MSAFLNFVKEKSINKVLQVSVNDIMPNPYQPRTEFDTSDITSLAESIRQNGILQPLTVRKAECGYELIAGERRLRASKYAGLEYVPCIVLDISQRNSAILALVENIQRENLSFFDEAYAIERLISVYGMTQEEAASKLGKAQSTIANKLRLLKLNDDERALIIKEGLTERHARALLRLAAPEDRAEILKRIIRYKLNVEKTELAISDYIEKNKIKESYRKRSKVFSDIRLFVNTINKAVETMKAAGISANSCKTQNEDYIEYKITIPITK